MATESSRAGSAVCFTISGEFLTDHCRSLVLEGRWRAGLRILTEGLHGITTDQALSVLKGTHMLRGENEVDLVEDDGGAAEYLHTLTWQWSGLWQRFSLGTWVPYAQVTCFGSGDLPTRRMGSITEMRKRKWADLRALPTRVASHCMPSGDPWRLAMQAADLAAEAQRRGSGIVDRAMVRFWLRMAKHAMTRPLDPARSED